MRTTFLIILAIATIAGCNKDAKPVKTFYADGKTPKEEYEVKDGKKNGDYKAYDEKGILKQEQHYTNDTLDGLQQFLFASGKTEIEANYTKGLYEGSYKSYFENGNGKELGQYKHNEMTGAWQFFYESGKIKEEVTFEHNQENGPYKSYYETGEVDRVGQYTDGNEEGVWKEYYPNGKLKEELTYVAGQEQGECIEYDENGMKVKRFVYDKGFPVESEEYDDKGNEINKKINKPIH